MFRYYSILIVAILFSCQLSGQSYLDKKGKTQLWGEVVIADLQKGDFQEWYNKNYDDHTSSLKKADAHYLKGVEVEIYLGTWCGDTKYLLPRFIKSWEAMGLSAKKLKLIALHREGELYKQGPKGETEGMNIHRVPTFVFEKGGEEIGRIVERTVFDLDTDIMAIAKEQPYQERYKGVSILGELFEEVELDSLQTKKVINSTYAKIRREVIGPGELNTYGYVLMAQNKIQEAAFVFKLNRFIFPFNPNTRDSFGEVLFKQGDFENAKLHYLESIRINPKNDNALEQLVLINEEMEKEKEGE